MYLDVNFNIISYIKHRKGLDMDLKFIITVVIIAEFFLGCASKVVPVDCVGDKCIANIIPHRNIYQDNNITKFHKRG